MIHQNTVNDGTSSSVVGLECECPLNYVDKLHTHERSQLIYASRGMMTVTTPEACYVVPPQRALWVPAGHPHEVFYQRQVSLRTLYFDNAVLDFGGGKCCLIEISDLLKQLILEVIKTDSTNIDKAREKCAIYLLINEIRRMPKAPYQVSMPLDNRLLRVCKTIIDCPSDRRNLDELAVLAGMSRRSFTRLFKEETGMGLESWRRQVRLIRALSLLSDGLSVTEVAYDVGYDSPSAFTAMFRRSFGVTPRAYKQDKGLPN